MFWRSVSVRLCTRIPSFEYNQGIWVQQRSEEYFLRSVPFRHGLGIPALKAQGTCAIVVGILINRGFSMDTNSTNPILLAIPERFESERLIIRAPLLDDGPMVNAAVSVSIGELRPWMPWARTVPTGVAEQNIRRRAN